jgi:hypothetical protein
MIDFNKNIVSALEAVLPTYYEMALTSKTQTPCISYMELNNSATDTGDTIGYSRINYQVKVWGNDIGVLINYAKQIDNVLRKLGFKRISSNEIYDNNSSMIQKILHYEGLAVEKFN